MMKLGTIINKLKAEVLVECPNMTDDQFYTTLYNVFSDHVEGNDLIDFETEGDVKTKLLTRLAPRVEKQP